MAKAFDLEMFDRLSREFKHIGFQFVALDVDGYRTGALNEILTQIQSFLQMKILVIGSGGREHAIVDALAQNSKVQQIFAAPGNGGIAGQATNIPIAADNVAALRDFARDEKIDLTFVGPEVPLSLGVVDLFRSGGLKIVGPNAENAQLESSKTYSKTILQGPRDSDCRLLAMRDGC